MRTPVFTYFVVLLLFAGIAQAQSNEEELLASYFSACEVASAATPLEYLGREACVLSEIDANAKDCPEYSTVSTQTSRSVQLEPTPQYKSPAQPLS